MNKVLSLSVKENKIFLILKKNLNLYGILVCKGRNLKWKCNFSDYIELVVMCLV